MKKRITLECLCNRYADIETPCCNFFKQMLNDCHIRLMYVKHSRMFAIRFTGSKSAQGILYCPWCGTKFPEPLDGGYNHAGNYDSVTLAQTRPPVPLKVLADAPEKDVEKNDITTV